MGDVTSNEPLWPHNMRPQASAYAGRHGSGATTGHPRLYGQQQSHQSQAYAPNGHIRAPMAVGPAGDSLPSRGAGEGMLLPPDHFLQSTTIGSANENFPVSHHNGTIHNDQIRASAAAAHPNYLMGLNIPASNFTRAMNFEAISAAVHQNGHDISGLEETEGQDEDSENMENLMEQSLGEK